MHIKTALSIQSLAVLHSPGLEYVPARVQLFRALVSDISDTFEIRDR